MKNLLSRFVLLLTLLVLSGWTTVSFAQSINVSGTVVDAETDEPLIGATVRVKGVASQACATHTAPGRNQVPGSPHPSDRR